MNLLQKKWISHVLEPLECDAQMLVSADVPVISKREIKTA